MAQNTDATDAENSKDQTFAAIKERFDSADGNVEVSEQELKELDVLDDYSVGRRDETHVNHDGPIVVQGSRDADPVKYFLVRVGDGQWISLKYLYKLIDSDPQWYVTNIGDIEVEGAPLDDGFGDDLPLDDETIGDVRSAYVRECEKTFDFVEDAWAAAFDGSRVFIELEEPWIGLDYAAEDLDIDDEVWEYEVRDAIVDARPANPRSLDTSLTAEFAVDITFE